MTLAHGAQPKLIETVDVTGKRTTSRRSMGGCQIIRTGLFPHSSDKAVTVSCGLGHTCRRSSSLRSSSAAATLKIVGSAIVRLGDHKIWERPIVAQEFWMSPAMSGAAVTWSLLTVSG